MGCGGSRALPPAKDPLTVYVWPGSAPCRAVLMTAKAANIPITVVNVNVMKGEQKTDSFKKMNPEATVPVLVDKKDNKELGNSHEIMPYLMDVYAPDHPIYPSDASRRNAIDASLKYDQTKVYPAISEWVYPQIFRDQEPNPDLFKQVRAVLDHLDGELSSTPYLAYRSVSIADLATAANLSLLELVYYEVSDWKNVWAWLKRIKGLSYYAASNQGLEKWKTALYVKQQRKKEREGEEALRMRESIVL